MPEMRMMATTGMLGYGYTEEAFRRGLAQKPDFIAADGGSMDPRPGVAGTSRSSGLARMPVASDRSVRDHEPRGSGWRRARIGRCSRRFDGYGTLATAEGMTNG